MEVFGQVLKLKDLKPFDTQVDEAFTPTLSSVSQDS